MDAVALTVGISWTLAGLLCLAVSLPLVRGKVGRNAFYGVRIPQAFQSDEAWLEINRYGGKRLAIWSVPMVVTGVVCLFLPLQSNTALTLVLGFGPLAFVLIPLLESWRFAQRKFPTR